MATHSPTIIKRAEQSLLAIETAVRGFARYHKYSVGQELRQQARSVVRHAMAAWRDRDQRVIHVDNLVDAVDALKIELQLAQNLQAFKSFAQFQSIYEVVADIGKQCGGWHRELHRSQNAQTRSHSPAQRAQRLSAGAASVEAHP